MKTETKVDVRWLIRRDLQSVIRIDRAVMTPSWSEEDFHTFLRQRNCIGMVADTGHKIVGFIVYELLKTKLNVLRVAIHPQYRRTGIGRAIIKRMRDKLSQQRRTEIVFDVPEESLGAQLWLKACGGECIGIVADEESNVYRFTLRLEEKSCSN